MKVAAELNKAISFPRILAILKLLVVSVELTEGLNFVFEVVVLNGSQTHTLRLRELFNQGGPSLGRQLYSLFCLSLLIALCA